MYNKIKNPITNRYVNINSTLGKTILNNYINTLNGGEPMTGSRSKRARKNWGTIRKENNWNALRNRSANNTRNIINKTKSNSISAARTMSAAAKVSSANARSAASTKAKSNWKYLNNEVRDKSKEKYSKLKNQYNNNKNNNNMVGGYY